MNKPSKPWGLRLGVAFLLIVGLASLPLLHPGNRLIMKATFGNVNAMIELGNEYQKLSRAWVKRDIPSSVYWLKRAAEAGRTDVYYSLGRMEGLTPEESIYWYKRGAEKGNPNCMGELAKSYQFGINGVQKDPIVAKKWWDLVNEIDRKNRGYPTQPY